MSKNRFPFYFWLFFSPFLFMDKREQNMHEKYAIITEIITETVLPYMVTKVPKFISLF
jgi:hypothetical protein